MNPDNFSKPPSSRGLDKPVPKPKSLRKSGQRKPGRNKGHLGQSLAQVANPTKTERHEPARCCGCGDSLVGAPEVVVERRQVFDLPPIEVKVTEHQRLKQRCGCCVVTGGSAPAGVTAPVQCFFHALVQLAEGRPWLPETIQPLGQLAIVGRSASLPVAA
jgi:transposase